MELTVSIKNVYGNELMYPVCDKSKLFAKLAGQKTLTWHTTKVMKELGYTLKHEQVAL